MFSDMPRPNGGGSSENIVNVLNTSTLTQNGTQWVTLNLEASAQEGYISISNYAGSGLSIEGVSDCSYEILKTDSTTYVMAKLTNFTSSTPQVNIYHNRANVNQAAMVFLVYIS